MQFYFIFFLIILLLSKYLRIYGMFTPKNRSRLIKTSSAIVSTLSKSPQQIKSLVVDLNRGCRSGGAMVVKEADEVWNRSGNL
uniref:Secreted protein n=1 Tax=Meloidogyne hapla TaxID=6305 RepID=A0A1I8BQR0_MELHA